MVWYLLRMSRWKPPGLASGGERADLYRAALQQFEDLMAASAASGPAGSPLPLYYAISQAGRALLAAREEDMTRVVCSPEHHGLTVRRNDVTDDLFAVPVRAVRPDVGLFQRVAAATESPMLADAAPMGALAASLPDAGDEGWNDERWPAATFLYPMMNLMDDTVTEPDVRSLDAGQFQLGRLRVAIGVDHVSGPGDLGAFVSHFPTISDRNPLLPVTLPSGQRGRVEVRTPSGPAIQVEISVTPGSADPSQDHLSSLNAIAPQYRWHGRRWLRPAVESGLLTPSPLMTWWAILFALSSMARYHPVAWTNALSVDKSPIAVVLERILSLAHEAVPHLVFEALRLVDSGQLLLPPGTDTPPVGR